jgi:hypothetical protein
MELNNNIKNILNFAINKKFPDFISLILLRKIAYDEFIPTLDISTDEKRNKYIDSIKEFEFFDPAIYYTFIDKSKINEDFMRNISNFRDELIIAIDKEFNPNYHANILERQVSPPLKAYEYQGHSQLNIKTSDSDYGKLFE